MTDYELDDSAEKQQKASSRSNCYGLLAVLFRGQLTSEFVARLRVPPMADALHELGYDAAADLAGPLEDVTDSLRQEYSRIFIGPGPHVSLYASVHHPKEGQLWGDSTVLVKRFIDATGLSFEGNWDSIPDHVAIELELMQRLASHEAELWGAQHDRRDDRLLRCVEAEERFLREHLCGWLPRFCDAVSGISVLPFYKEVARLCEMFVLSDVEHVTAARSECRSSSSVGPGDERASRCAPRPLG